jgi:hypothetical protein
MEERRGRNKLKKMKKQEPVNKEKKRNAQNVRREITKN